MVDNEIIIIGAFLGTGLLAYVVIPGLLVMWDRVLDHMEESGSDGTRLEKTVVFDHGEAGGQDKKG
jgi:hypothetical protein